jgi:hypothetical protein
MDNEKDFERVGKLFTANFLNKLKPDKIYRLLVS